MMEVTDSLNDQDKDAIYNLWNELYPKPVIFGSIKDFDSFLSQGKKRYHIILRDSQNKLIGWLSVFDRVDIKNFVMLVSEQHQGIGIGRSLVNEMKKREVLVQGYVVKSNDYTKGNGELYLSPIEFYTKSGFILTGEKLKKEDFETYKIIWSKTHIL